MRISRTCERTPAVRGRSRLEVGASAAEVSGAMTLRAVRLLSRWARRTPGAVRLARREAARSFPGELDSGVLMEAEGAARALSLETDDLRTAAALGRSLAMAACTNFGAIPPATAAGDTMLSWNFDASHVLGSLMGRFPLYTRELDSTIPYLCLGVPALFGIGIMNAEGLCSVVNAVGVRDEGDGLTPFELNNRAMETCSTVDEAAEVFSDGPRKAIWSMSVGLLMNWNMIWADAGGDLSVFEYSANHFKRERAGAEGIVASANHHQFLDHELSGSFDPSEQEIMGGSYSRLARMWALLRENHGRIDPLTARAIISDHVPDYSTLREYGISDEWWSRRIDDSTICAHAWNVGKYLMKGQLEKALMEISFSTTLFSLQVQPRSATTWFTLGHPCRGEAVPVYWGSQLGMSARRPDGVLEPGAFKRAAPQSARRGIFRAEPTPLERFLAGVWLRIVGRVESGMRRELEEATRNGTLPI